MSRHTKSQYFKSKPLTDKEKYEGCRGLVYVRVSSKKQEIEGHGRDSQEGRCKSDLISIGVPHAKTFADTFTGSGDFMRRPAMRELLEYIDARPTEKFIVVFDDLSRFARDVAFHLKLRTEFRARGVLLRCLNYDLNETEEGQYVELIFAGKAELDRKQNRRQVIQKQRARLELGYWAFGSRHPYKMTKDFVHGRILVPQYPRAQWLKEALEGFAKGVFVRKIDACKFLVEKGYWTGQRAEKYIDKFTQLAADPLFAGFIEYPKWEVTLRKGHHEPLISQETHDLIKKRLRKEGLGQRIRIDISPEFPQRGLVLCDHCGSSLRSGWSKGRSKMYAYYSCHNRGCERYGKSIDRGVIESKFNELLKANTLKSEVDPLVELVFDRAWKDEVRKFEKQKSIATSRKMALEEKAKELTKLIIAAKAPSVKKAYESQLEETALEIEQAENNSLEGIDLAIPYRTALERSKGLLRSPYAVWQALEVIEQQRLFYFIFEEKLRFNQETGYRTDKIRTAARLFEEFAAVSSTDVEMRRIELRCNG